MLTLWSPRSYEAEPTLSRTISPGLSRQISILFAGCVLAVFGWLAWFSCSSLRARALDGGGTPPPMYTANGVFGDVRTTAPGRMVSTKR
jgi:hypothetical protein